MSARDYLNTDQHGQPPTKQSTHYRLALISVNGSKPAKCCGNCDMDHRNHCDLGWDVDDRHVCDRWIKRGAGNPKLGRQ